MIVLDASVMIAILDADDANFDAARDLFRTHLVDELRAHRLTLAETLVRAAKRGRGAAVRDALGELGITAVDTLDDPLELAELRARTGLRMPDACVLYAALRAGSAIATFDERLAASAREAGVVVL